MNFNLIVVKLEKRVMLALGYIAFTFVMVLILFFLGKWTIDRSSKNQISKRKYIMTLAIGLLFWHIFVYGIASTGILKDLSFPPKFALLLIMPLFIFTGIFLYKQRHSNWLMVIPPHWLVFYQSPRIIIESLFVASVADGILHKNVTLEGYNYDMFFGISAIVIGTLFFKKFISHRFVLYWNYIGLLFIAFIIFLFNATIYTPHIFGDNTLPMPSEFANFPYVLVAGFLMPTAVFIHVLSITQYYKLHNPSL